MKHFITFLVAMSFGFMTQAADVVTGQTEFKWTGKKVTGQHYGTLPIKDSKVNEEKGQIVGGEFVLDISKMTVDDLTGEYKTKFINHMKSEDFFQVEKWPTARLVVKKMDGKMAYGELTIKDKTHAVNFPYTKKDNVYTGTLKFDRTKYGMIYGSGNFFKNLGDKLIYNDVTLDFKVTVKTSAKKSLSMNGNK